MCRASGRGLMPSWRPSGSTRRTSRARTPASIVVANHVMGLFELAALHLSQQPANLPQAQLAIDAMAAIVEGLGSRLEQSEATLKEALAQIRLAYVQLQEASANQ